MTVLYLDSETFSPLSLIKVGTHRYAEQAEIMLSAFAFDNDPPTVIDHTAGEKLPADVIKFIKNGDGRIRIHNSSFDRTLYRMAMGLHIPVERIDDMMVIALQHSLPGGLGVLGQIFNVGEEHAKLASGKELIHLFCKPIPFKCEIPPGMNKSEEMIHRERMKRSWTGRATRITHPKAWERFKAYAGNDITAMQAIWPRIPKWNSSNPFERQLWELDQRINDRGFAVDLDLARTAIEAVNEHQEALAVRTQDLTDNEVQKATQRDALLKYILEYHGVTLPDMKKSTLERRLNDESLPWAVRELIAVRLDASAASVGKYDALMRTVSSDGRLRGTIQFCGANRTGRDAGRIFQPQNIARPSVKQEMIDSYVDAFRGGYIDLLVTNPIQAAADCLRSSIIAAPGKKLVQADLANIEGRHLAWQADEEWKLQAFREYDTITGYDAKGKPIRKGHDLYVLAFAKSFGVEPEEVSDADRQKGKVQELALGFEGGVGAFVAFSLVYKIDLADMADNAWPRLSNELKRETEWGWKRANDRHKTFGLSERVYRTCDAFKILWRRAHPNIVEMWKAYKEAMIAAIQNPGTEFHQNRVIFHRPAKSAWTYIQLPSGRRLCYPMARVDEGQISYMGINSYSRKWQRIKTFGGKITENIDQAGSRDVFMNGIPALEKSGYPVILRVHDEVVCEVPDTEDYSYRTVEKILSTNPEYAPDLPLAAAGWEAHSYRKG